MSTTTNNSIRARWAAIGAAVAVTLGAVGIGGYNLANAEVEFGNRPVFIAINPCRLTDTRPAPNTVGPRATPIGTGETATITAHGTNGECTIPSDALSLSLNVTALQATQPSFLTFWGEGANPGTANLNPTPGQPPTPNAVNTPLSASGTFNVYNEAGDVNVVIDVNGYYAHHGHEFEITEYLPVSQSSRADTCEGGVFNPLDTWEDCTTGNLLGDNERHSVTLIADFGWYAETPAAAGHCELRQDGVSIPDTRVLVGTEQDDTNILTPHRAGINHVIFAPLADDEDVLTGFHQYGIYCQDTNGDVDYVDLSLTVIVMRELGGADF